MRTIEQMVQQEIMCCMSSLVSALAQGAFGILNQVKCHDMKALADLGDQAAELAAPIPDYEEAALQAGYKVETIGADDWQYTTPDGNVHGGFDSFDEACANAGIEPYGREVFEHWAVTQWLADKLVTAGEKVDNDFGGLCVWARTTTGQNIAQDDVIQRIYAQIMELVT
jgi:hypothetical protein